MRSQGYLVVLVLVLIGPLFLLKKLVPSLDLGTLEFWVTTAILALVGISMGSSGSRPRSGNLATRLRNLAGQLIGAIVIGC
jgi:hypothetical protein